MSEWIKVSNKKPTDSKPVLCSNAHGSLFIGFYLDSDWYDEDDLLRDPSHWMPLPEPPK